MGYGDPKEDSVDGNEMGSSKDDAVDNDISSVGPVPIFKGIDQEEKKKSKAPEDDLKTPALSEPEDIEIGPVPRFNDGDGGSDKETDAVDLEYYVFNCLKQGFSERSIKKVATEAGWSGGEIDKVFFMRRNKQ